MILGICSLRNQQKSLKPLDDIQSGFFGLNLNVMMLKKILSSHLLIISLLTLVILGGMLFKFYPLQALEYKAYDLMAGRPRSEDTDPVVIVAVDEESIQRIGSWPWPRSYIADMIRLLSRYGTDTLGICLLYSHEELNPGLQEIKNLRENLRMKPFRGAKQTLNNLNEILAGAERRLNHDASLVSAVKSAKNVVLPFLFTLGLPTDEKTSKMSSLLTINSLNLKKDPADSETQRMRFGKPVDVWKERTVVAKAVTETFRELAGKAGALGHINLITDKDGTVRKAPLLIYYQGRYFPSFPLQMAAKYKGRGIKDIIPEEDGIGFTGFRINSLRIPTDRYYRMLFDYNLKRSEAKTYSFYDVLNENISPDAFRNKVVLIGVTAKGLAPLYKTTAHSEASLVEILENVLENILNRTHLSRPRWALALEVLSVLYFALFLMFVIPRVNFRVGVLILGIFIITWIGIAAFLLIGYGYWIKFFAPVHLSVFAYALVGFKSFSRKQQDERVELNKTLGLSFQGQGMLDMAFEKFMKCPVEDKSVKTLFYNLGLDFERKRMFNKALIIYEHLQKSGNFKDIKNKIEKLKNVGETFALSSGLGIKDTTVLQEDTMTKPTFGRYEILKELGRGAMSTVYLGKDPKINREVAIKILRYKEIDERDLKEMKIRFFREAEAAGKLSHPNIVAIFDAGEEQDMAYIAMELLVGKNLTAYCRKGKLLSMKNALKVAYYVAKALDYAHNQKVVHRDIKPANIMLLKDKQVKVTDFGIARVLASSMTKTGIIIGTPGYMSPEQVAGRDVDGRSDLFSLGAVLYELLTGERPFKGDSITTLMYAVLNCSYTPISEVLPDIPDCCVEIVGKLLQKAVTKRFNTASKLVKEIQLCLGKLE
ncbi:MAG: CHASE2 domain-containing protein [Candidatus Aminicenantes bacterium]|nr:MAG: CHASE2 domain-containing protein [Candidatus Aminicenantes bacterium]